MEIKRFATGYVIGFVIGLYTTFVIQVLWNWFVVRAFSVPQVSFWIMYGILMTVGMFTSKDPFQAVVEQKRWKIISAAIDACIPDQKKDLVTEAINGEKDMDWMNTGIAAVTKIAGNTAVLGVAWVISTFLT